MLPTILTKDHFEIFSYPAGEIQVRLPERIQKTLLPDAAVALLWYYESLEDWPQMLLALDALDGLNLDVRGLVLPYLPFGRADRRFVPGDCWGKSVFLDTISAAWYHIKRPLKVVTVDAHSVLVSRSSCASVEDYFPLDAIKKAVVDFKQVASFYYYGDLSILLPDKGAFDRYAKKLPPVIEGNAGHIKLNFFAATKKRNPETGKFEGFTLPADIPTYVPLLMVDDICDGGGTFVGLAEELARARHTAAIGLYVTHGIFSKGLQPLFDAGIQFVYTTDTRRIPRMIGDSRLTVFHVVNDAIKAVLS